MVIGGITAVTTLTDEAHIPTPASLFHPGDAKCVCAIGFYEKGLPLLVDRCRKCNEACLACVDETTTCKVCSSIGYRIYFSQCVTQCPYGYYANSTTGVCEYEEPSVEVTYLDSPNC